MQLVEGVAPHQPVVLLVEAVQDQGVRQDLVEDPAALHPSLVGERVSETTARCRRPGSPCPCWWSSGWLPPSGVSAAIGVDTWGRCLHGHGLLLQEGRHDSGWTARVCGRSTGPTPRDHVGRGARRSAKTSCRVTQRGRAHPDPEQQNTRPQRRDPDEKGRCDMTVLWVADIAAVGAVVLLAVGRAVAVSRLERQLRTIRLDDDWRLLGVPPIDLPRHRDIFEPSGHHPWDAGHQPTRRRSA